MLKQIRKANWFLLFLICFFIGGSLGIGKLCMYVDLPYNLRVMSGQILIGLSLIIFFTVTRTNPFKMIQHKRLGIVDILLVILLMFLMLPLVYFINYISMFFTKNEVADTIGGMVDNSYWMNLLMLAVTPAVVEELVCRGVLFHAYKRKNFLAAVLLTAFIFGLLHMNLNQMLYAGVIGVVFALVVEVTGSIYSSMIMHFIMNSISVTLLAFLKLMKDIGLYSDEMLEMEMQQVQNSAVAEIPTSLTIILLTVAFLVVVGSTALAAGVIILLAKRSGRADDFKTVFKKKNAEDVAELYETPGGALSDGDAVAADSGGFKSLIIDIPFILAVLIAFAVMIFL